MKFEVRYIDLSVVSQPIEKERKEVEFLFAQANECSFYSLLVGASYSNPPLPPSQSKGEASPLLQPVGRGYISSDGYEGLSFQDAVSNQNEVQTLHKSASDQVKLKFS